MDLTKELMIIFKWNTIDKVPKLLNEPILCLTKNEKLCVFNNTEGMYKERNHFIKYSNFNRLAEKYKVKYWVYQKDLII